MLLFISISWPTFFRERENISSDVVCMEERVISACTCACRARVSSQSATNMSFTCIRVASGEESKERKTGKGSEKTRYLKLHGSVYYLLSAISASTEKVHPTDDRRMICAPDALESARSINEDAHMPRAIGRGSQFEFLPRSRPIVTLRLLFFFLFRLPQLAKKRGKQISRDNFEER